MAKSMLGKLHQEGEIIVKQGDKSECMYVIQSGEVEILHERESEGDNVRLTILGQGDFFGEVPLFERFGTAGSARATARAISPSQVLTVDKQTILRRINEDPSLAYRILQTMSRRIFELESEMVKLITGT